MTSTASTGQHVKPGSTGTGGWRPWRTRQQPVAPVLPPQRPAPGARTAAGDTQRIPKAPPAAQHGAHAAAGQRPDLAQAGGPTPLMLTDLAVMARDLQNGVNVALAELSRLGAIAGHLSARVEQDADHKKTAERRRARAQEQAASAATVLELGVRHQLIGQIPQEDAQREAAFARDDETVAALAHGIVRGARAAAYPEFDTQQIPVVRDGLQPVPLPAASARPVVPPGPVPGPQALPQRRPAAPVADPVAVGALLDDARLLEAARLAGDVARYGEDGEDTLAAIEMHREQSAAEGVGAAGLLGAAYAGRDDLAALPGRLVNAARAVAQLRRLPAEALAAALDALGEGGTGDEH